MLAPQSPTYQSTSDKPRFQATDAVLHVFLPHSPLMQVVEPVRIKGAGKEQKIAGIRCCWFGPDATYKSEIFNTTMLRHAKAEELPAEYKPRTLNTLPTV